MSIENIYDYIQGEFQSITLWEQAPAGVDPVFITDVNNVKMLCGNISIFADSGGLTPLIEDADYTLEYLDSRISQAEGILTHAGYQVINPIYQGIELYVSADCYGGYTYRPYRPTYTAITASDTLTPGSEDDSVLADTTGGPITVTLEDGERVNQRYTVLCVGGNDVTISGAGINDTYNDIGVSYFWDGVKWNPLGGAGSGGGATQGNLGIGQIAWFAGNGPVPFDKLLCDGTLYDIADYPGLFAALGTAWGGDGITTFGVPDLRGIHPGMIGTSTINGRIKGDAGAAIGDYLEDQMQQITGELGGMRVSSPFNVDGAFTSNAKSAVLTGAGGSLFGVDFDSANSPDARTGDHTDVSRAMGRWLIQAFDTVQEVPGDPALVRDWVNKWTNPDPQTNIVTTLPNTWGEGLFLFGISYVYDGGEVRSNASLGILQDGLNRSFLVTTDQGGTGSSLYLNYIGATNTWEIVEDGTAFTSLSIFSINKWEAVTGEDIVLNPPVDGWEEVWDDGGAGNITSVLNSWGNGQFEVDVEWDSTPSDSGTASFSISNNTDIRQCDISVSSGSSTSSVYMFYNQTPTTFEVFNTGTPSNSRIVRIRKFNSLINLVHSYNPDPRSVAQKSWIEVWSGSTTAGVLNVWGTGKYIITINNTYTYWIDVQALDSTFESAKGRAAGDNYNLARYDSADGKFKIIAVNSNTNITNIQRWQDSQASDAPRTVLDDGWETVFDDDTNTADVPNSWGAGVYELLVKDFAAAGQDLTQHITITEEKIASGVGDVYAPSYTGAGTSTNIMAARYDVDQNLFTLDTGGIWTGSIIRIRKFTGLLRISANYNVTSLSDGPNQVKSINTDAGDVDAGVPASPVLGDLFEVWNTGTNGNHVTGLPDGITLGDGKGIRLRYVDGWRYEDCIVDEYVSGSNEIQLWAGGMRITWTSGASPVYDRWK